MSLAVTAIRRSIWLLLVGAVGGVAWSWWSDRNAPPSPTAPPEWPPLDALVDAPDAPSSSDAGGWATPAADGACPISHPVKANDNSGIFHLPGGRFYDRTKPERCYTSPDAAIADGYRQSKS